MTKLAKKINAFISKHPVAIFYVLGLLMMAVQLKDLKILFRRDFSPHWVIPTRVDHLSFTLTNLADAAMLMLPLLLLKPKWRKWFWVIIWLFTLWCLAQALYHPNYLDIMPYSSFLLYKNVSGLLIESAIGAFKPSMARMLILPAGLYLLYRLLLAKPLQAAPRPHAGASVAISLLFFLSNLILNPLLLEKETEESLDNLYAETGERPSALQRCVTGLATAQGQFDLYFLDHGLIAYTAYSIGQQVKDLKGIGKSEKQAVHDFLAASPHYTDNAYCAGRKNVIFIIVESLNAWVVNLTIDGREVTPTLNRLAADTSNCVGLHMKSQVKNGHSSDGHFMYLTGFAPLLHEAVSMNYGNIAYPSLPKAFGCKNNIVYACDYPSLWNIGKTMPNYGFNHLHLQDSVKTYYPKHNNLTDQALFHYASDHLAKERQPFFALIITQKMHTPYTEAEVPPTWISNSRQYTNEVRNYLERTHFFDEQLGQFLHRLQAAHLYDQSLIVIASDHTEGIDNAPNGRPAISPKGNDCLLLALNSGHGLIKQEAFGQVDVYPTLLDLMGRNNYYWKGVGNSIVRTRVESAVVTPGVVEGNAQSPLVKRQQQAWAVSHHIIVGRCLPQAGGSKKH